MFLGFDHIDTRVPSISAVEPFYDKLMPALGLSEKRYSNVDENANWSNAEAANHNTVEYYEPARTGAASFFIGFIEDRAMSPTSTRIAFRVDTLNDAQRWLDFLSTVGAQKVELSDDMGAYPAIFFQDPSGTRLEICARKAPS